MKNMTLDNIAKCCHGTYVGEETLRNREVSNIVIDSRQVEKDALFVAIRGERVDGHKFIPAVYEAGALAVISEEELPEAAGPYILVESGEQALKDMAAFYRNGLDCKVVGIVGSVGKTSTKEMVASVLEQKYRVLKTEGNFNNEIGVPLTIFRLREEHEVAVIEMGISDFGEMHRLSTMTRPDVCVFTNIGMAHLEQLKTRDGILKAKTECFEHMSEGGVVILNGDDDKLSTVKDVNGQSPIFYGVGKDAADGITVQKTVYATNIENCGLEGMRAVIHTSEDEFFVIIPIPGEHNVYNALAATGVGRHLGLSVEQICAGIQTVATISGRTHMIKVGDITLIDDCYNANPVSMAASLDVLRTAKGRKIAVLGDMGELGENERELHYQVGSHFAEDRIDALFCAGDLSRETARAVQEAGSTPEVYHYDKKEALMTALLPYLSAGDTVLIKASHFMHFPEIVTYITENYR